MESLFEGITFIGIKINFSKDKNINNFLRI